MSFMTTDPILEDCWVKHLMSRLITKILEIDESAIKYLFDNPEETQLMLQL